MRFAKKLNCTPILQADISLYCPITINSKQAKAVLDTGATVSLMSLEIISYFHPNWQELENSEGPIKGLAANNSEFEFVGCKYMDVTIGNITRKVAFSISEYCSNILLGLDALSLFEAKFNFSPFGVQIVIGDLMGSYTHQNEDKLLGTNEEDIQIGSLESKMCKIKISDNITSAVCCYAGYNSSSSLIPCIIDETNINHGFVYLLYRNTTGNELYLPKNTQEIRYCALNSDNSVINIESLNQRMDFNVFPEKFTNLECAHNLDFYQPVHINLMRNTTIEDTDSQLLHTKDHGIGIPGKCEFDIPKIINESIPQRIPDPHRQRLVDFFMSHQSLCARYDFDAGALTDCHGNIIKMSVPLITKLPYRSKYYKLSPEDTGHVDDIVSYLIHAGLAVECEPGQCYGQPCFIVYRGNKNLKQSSPPRLIIDTRETNSYLSGPKSLQSSSVLEVIHDIKNTANFITLLDLKNCYYSIFLDQEALDSGVSNICIKGKVIKLLVSPTGLANVPLWLRTVLLDQLNRDDKGNRSPLDEINKAFLRQWFDDLAIFTRGSLADHIIFVEKVLMRLYRLNIRLNLAKCTIAANLSCQSVDLLGYSIGMSKIQPTRQKLDKLSKMEPPHDVQSLQRFLGFCNFMHNLLPLSVSHLLSILSKMTSNKKPFVWGPTQQESFEQIKLAILSGECHTYLPPPHASICIIYTDASDTLMGGCLYWVDISSCPDDTVSMRDLSKLLDCPFNNLNETFPNSKYFQTPRNKRLTVGTQIETCLTHFCETVKVDMPAQIDFISLLIYAINANVESLYSRFGLTSAEIKEITKDLENNRYTATKCFTNPTLMAFLIARSIKRNAFVIKLDESSNHMSFLTGEDIYDTSLCAILFVYDNVSYNLLYLTQDTFINSVKVKTHNKVSVMECTEPNLIFKYFLQACNSREGAAKVRLQGQFSKTIPDHDRNLPIWQKESLSLLYSLDQFRIEIENSKLALLASDSRATMFMFNKQVQTSVKKCSRYSIKLACDYPNVRVIPVSGPKNVSDFFSRIGVTKKEIFQRGLSPISLNNQILEKYKDKTYSWKEVSDICEKEPDLIQFEDSKLEPLTTKFAKIPQMNRLKLPSENFTSFNIFDKFLNLQTLAEHQRDEYDIINLVSDKSGFSIRNEVLMFGDKPVLPTNLYGLAVLREHFLTSHSGREHMKNNITALYSKTLYLDIRMSLSL